MFIKRSFTKYKIFFVIYGTIVVPGIIPTKFFKIFFTFETQFRQFALFMYSQLNWYKHALRIQFWISAILASILQFSAFSYRLMELSQVHNIQLYLELINK